MPNELKRPLAVLAMFVSLTAGLSGLVGGCFVLPYRVEALENQRKSEQPLLMDIRERVIRIEEQLKQKGKE